jgi:hypothetical protein
MSERDRNPGVSVPFVSVRSQLLLIILGVDLSEAFPLLRQVIQRKDGGNGANWDTSPTVDTLYRIDVKLGNISEITLVFPRVYAIHWADIDTRSVFSVDARFSNDICHTGILRRALPIALMIRPPCPLHYANSLAVKTT